jgi:hypothetical protein
MSNTSSEKDIKKKRKFEFLQCVTRLAYSFFATVLDTMQEIAYFMLS